MLVVVIVERVLPLVHAVAPVLIERAELVRLVEVHELHTAEHGIAHQYGESTAILHHGLFCAGRGKIGGRFGRVGIGSGMLPFVHQRGVDGTDHHAQPGDDVVKLLVALFLRNGTRQRTVGVGQVPQQRAFGTGDVVAGDVAGEIGSGLHHVAHHGFRAQPIVVRPRHIMAVFIERGLQHILQRLRIGDLLKPVHTLVIVEAILFHADHRLVARLTFLRAQHLLRVLQRGLNHGYHIQRIRVRLRVEQFQRGQQERA